MHMAVLLRWASSASPADFASPAFASAPCCCARTAGAPNAIAAQSRRRRVGFSMRSVDLLFCESERGNYTHSIMRFNGSDSYVATEDLTLAVNAAITLQRPLLVKGEPGTGKTMLAVEVARTLGVPLLEWHIKSTTKAQQVLYEYDAVSRLRDSQLGDERVHDIHNYIVKGMLWQAFAMDKPCGRRVAEGGEGDS